MIHKPKVLFLLLTCFAFLANAQQVIDAGVQPITLSEGKVGVPYNENLGLGFEELLSSSGDGVEFFVNYTLARGTLPPGLTFRGNGEIAGVPTTPGQYNFVIRVSLGARVEGSSVEVRFGFDTTIVVQPGTGATLTVDPGAVSFTAAQGATSPLQSSLVATNRTSQSRSVSVASTTFSGGSWLSTSGGVSVPAFSTAAIGLTANPSGLPAGVYVGQITTTSTPGGETTNISVLLTIRGAQQSINLSQTGLTFRTVAGVGTAPAQSFAVFNSGAGSLDWAANTSTLSGGSAWLSVSPATGSSVGTSTTPVTVRVNGAGLAAGDYYGQITITANGVANSPQVVSVLLNVLPATANPGPVVSPTALIFVAREGGTNPAAQNVQISNLTNAPSPFQTTPFFANGNNWFTLTPKTGTVTSASPAQVSVQAIPAGLAAGVYRGEITLRFADSGALRRVDILFIVLPRLGATAAKDSEPRVNHAEGCRPTRLLPVFTLLGVGFQSTAGWPIPVESRIVDDCGDPMMAGSAVVSFSTGDPPLVLASLNDGRWTGTWQAKNPDAKQVVITINARQLLPALSGTEQIGGNLAVNTGTPVINTGGVVSTASFSGLQPTAPGSLVAIFGSRLGQGVNVATELPLQTDLAGTRVTLAGRALPLIFTSDGQINASIPFDIPPNATHQLLVRRGTAYSLPEPLVVASAQPAVFTKNQSGKGEGIIVAVKPDGRQFVIGPADRASAGDTLVIYCAGLGAVRVPVQPGQPSPSSPLADTTNTVTVSIDGKPAVILFAGLTPGYVGLYQVNAVIPGGVSTGAAIPVTITVAGQTSPPVTIAVE